MRIGLAVVAAAALVAAAGCSKKDGSHGPAAPTSAPAIQVDRSARSVSISAAVAPQETYAELHGAIEYALVARGGKEYESLFVTDVRPQQLYDALLQVGLTPGQPAEASDEAPPKGLPVSILVEHVRDGKTVREPIDSFVLRVNKPADAPADAKDEKPASSPAPASASAVSPGKALAAVNWPFSGSFMAQDPQTGNLSLQAEMTQSLICLHVMDSSGLFQNPRPEARQNNIYHANRAALGPVGSPVRIIFQRPVARAQYRAHVYISGRVQGVGFRAFVESHAKRIGGLTGFVRNLADGRVEVLAEGPTARVTEFLDAIRQGPRAARIEKFDVTDEPAEGDLKTFEVWQ